MVISDTGTVIGCASGAPGMLNFFERLGHYLPETHNLDAFQLLETVVPREEAWAIVDQWRTRQGRPMGWSRAVAAAGAVMQVSETWIDVDWQALTLRWEERVR